MVPRKLLTPDGEGGVGGSIVLGGASREGTSRRDDDALRTRTGEARGLWWWLKQGKFRQHNRTEENKDYFGA